MCCYSVCCESFIYYLVPSFVYTMPVSSFFLYHSFALEYPYEVGCFRQYDLEKSEGSLGHLALTIWQASHLACFLRGQGELAHTGVSSSWFVRFGYWSLPVLGWHRLLVRYRIDKRRPSRGVWFRLRVGGVVWHGWGSLGTGCLVHLFQWLVSCVFP